MRRARLSGWGQTSSGHSPNSINNYSKKVYYQTNMDYRKELLNEIETMTKPQLLEFMKESLSDIGLRNALMNFIYAGHVASHEEAMLKFAKLAKELKN